MTLPASLPGLIERHAQATPDARALVFEDGTLSYGALAQRARGCAALLREHGVGPGDRVGIMVGNALDLPVALLGAARVGALLVPLHAAHRGEVLRYMAAHADPALLIVDPELVDDEQQRALPDRPQIAARPGRSELLAEAARRGDEDVPVAAAPDAPLSIMYTSGTTGRSKGVVLDQRFYLVEGDAYNQVAGATPQDVYGTVLPLSHANAQIASLVGAWLHGAPLVAWRRFSAGRFWDELRDAGVTLVNLLGAMAPILLKRHPEPVLDHGVRCTVGGAIPVAAAREFRARFGVDTREVFGLTEVGIVCGETDGRRRLGSAGAALGRWELRIDGDDDGGPGEIQIRGREPSTLFREYWRDPERTAEAFTADGWFRTGDLGALDADGFLTFVGRLKDCIRRRGENVSPDEVEMIVNRHPGVAESAAVPVPSPLAEDDIKLAYVPRPGADASPAAIHAFCVREMAPFMVPRYLEVRDALPRTPTLKVVRSALTSVAPPVVDMEAASASPQRKE